MRICIFIQSLGNPRWKPKMEDAIRVVSIGLHRVNETREAGAAAKEGCLLITDTKAECTALPEVSKIQRD